MKKVVLFCVALVGMVCAEAQIYPRRDYSKLANYDEVRCRNILCRMCYCAKMVR